MQRKGSMCFSSLKRPGKEVKKSTKCQPVQKPRSKAQLTHEMSVDSLSTKLSKHDMDNTSDCFDRCTQNEKFGETTKSVTVVKPKKIHCRKYVGSFAADAYEAARFDAELGGSSEVGIRFS